MGLRINTNSSAINAHRNMYVTDRNLNRSMEKISSGLRIVRAADGPASLIISEQMRSQIMGVEQAIRNTETGVAMLQTTEASLQEMNRMLSTMRALAVHAANEGVNDELMLQADQQEVDNILIAIDRIARNTSFGSRKVLDGTAGADGIATGKGVEFISANEKTMASKDAGYDVVISRASTKSAILGTQELTQGMVAAGEKLTVVENGKEATVVATADDSPETLVTRLQAVADRNGLEVEVSMTANKRVLVQHKHYGSNYRVHAYSDTVGVLSKEEGMMYKAAAGEDIAGTINGELAVGEGRTLTAVEGNPTTEGLKIRYVGTVGSPGGKEIDPDKGQLIGQVHVSQNSLRFQLGDSYDQSQSVSVDSLFSSELGNGVENDSGFKSLREIDIRTFEGANDALKLIEKSINKVSSLRGELGAFQKNLLSSNLNSMMVLRENMIFSESTIRDVDVADEMTNFTKQQMLQQTGMAMATHANESAKSILKILQ